MRVPIWNKPSGGILNQIMWTWQGLFCKLLHWGLTSTLVRACLSHSCLCFAKLLVITQFSQNKNLAGPVSVLLLPAMHLVVFLLPHSSQQGFHLLQIPASLSTSSPGAACYEQKVQEYRNNHCDTLGGSTNSAFPSQGRALCRRTAKLAAIVCWESEPSHQGTEAHGIQEMLWAILLRPIFKGDQGMVSSLWSCWPPASAWNTWVKSAQVWL